MRLLTLFSIVLLFTEVVEAQWQPDVRLTNDPGNSAASPFRGVAANGEFVHVIWDDNRNGNSEIYYKRSIDGGINWGADTRLTVNVAASTFPSITVSGSMVHVVWTDARDGNNEIYYKSSLDGGLTWGADMRLTNNTAISILATVAVSGSFVHVVWRDSRTGNQEIFYKNSSDGGITWGADMQLTNNIAASSAASVAVSGQVVHVIWQDSRDGNTEIYYKGSADAGTTWGSDTRLTNDIGSSSSASVSVSANAVHIFWNDNRDGNLEIYYKRSTDGGLNWGTDTRLTNDPAQSVSPSSAVSGGIVQLVWRDHRDGNPKVYYKRSTDGGTNWSADTRITVDPAGSLAASIAVSGSRVHVVWQDIRNTNFEIYYKQQSTGNSLPAVSAGNDTTIFYGYGIQQATLIATATGGTPPYLYLWSDGSTLPSITVSPSVSTNYSVTVTDELGSVASDNVQVNVIDVRCGKDQIYLCHNGHRICISSNAVSAHLAHGDYLGDCLNNNLAVNDDKLTQATYKLYPNYPNPFRQSTNIKFSIADETIVKLVVYNALGIEIVTLVNGRLKPGIYQVKWNAVPYPGGLYYYKLFSEGFTETQKMILVR